MKTTTLAAALVCLTALPAPALALDIGIGASAGASTSASSGEGGVSVGLGANANADADLSFGTTDSMAAGLTANASGAASLTVDDELAQVIALIEASVWTENSLSDVTDVEAVTYDVSAWINADNATAFDLALESNAGEIEDLQAAVAANANLEAWLEANNESAEDVIAIGVAADGSLAVFTN